ncbi:MAG TPA: DUF6455 family protein [Xanthobacteraceae bacterium]|nr:DUF6455 family protein [Xanthobacteraceae bacterium]
MSALPGTQQSRSLVEAVLQWCRNWTSKNTVEQLKCCGAEEVERIAKDVGLSGTELRAFASLGPEAAELLLQRMAALDLDRNEISRTELLTFRDLQRICTMCQSHGRCARDLARDAADPAWKDYCPNAATLVALTELPWARRRES